jgi:hypothetical protein
METFSSSSKLLSASVAVAIAFVLSDAVHGAVKERVYTMGDNDTGAVIGSTPSPITTVSPNRPGTNDIQPSTTDYGGVDPPSNVNFSLVPLVSFNANFAPRYIAAADRPGAAAGNLALNFDGINDYMYCSSTVSSVDYDFDPRDFGGQFATLSQAWVRPTATSFGSGQFIYRIGREQGGVKISSDGFWALRTGNPSAETPLADVEVTSAVAVVPNQWTHVAVFRGGNASFLYVNGSVAALDPGFWGDTVVEVSVGADDNTPAGAGSPADFFQGVIDNFNIGTPSDGVFNEVIDIDYFSDLNITYSGVAGDIDQDGIVDQNDYDIWSENVGYDNGFGFGDPTTLLLGDADQSGVIDLFDFQVINEAALNPPASASGPVVPEPASIVILSLGAAFASFRRTRSRRPVFLPLLILSATMFSIADPAIGEVVVADDFLYDGPTKLLHVGGGFNGYQQYQGGHNGPAGNWGGQWGQIGDGIITTPDYTPPIDPFNGLPEPVAPPNVALYDGFFGVQSELLRNFTLAGSVAPNQTLYFGGRFRADLDIGTDNHTVTQFYAPRLFLNRVGGDDRYFDINGLPIEDQRDRTQDIGLGFESFKNVNTMLIENSVVARLGAGPETKVAVTSPPPNDGNWHQIVGKLEINVAGGANERLTVWIDPTGVETGGTSAQVEADVLPDLSALDGTFHSQGTRPLNPTNNAMFPIDPADSLIENPAELGRSYIDDMAIGTAWQDVATVNVPRLTLRINRIDGSGTLINNTSSSFELHGYSIESEAGSLNGTGWNSLDEQNVGNWKQNLATANHLVETNFMGSTTVAAGGQLTLGNLFNSGGTEDLTGRFATADDLINLLRVEYASTVSIPGDHDNDGRVDTADYVVWRKSDGTQPGYNSWRTNFGRTSGSGAGVILSAVPELSTAGLIAIGLAVFAVAGCHRFNKIAPRF